MRADALRAIYGSQMSRFADDLVPLLRPSVRLIACGERKPGTTRLGGHPDLPPHIDWPIRAGRPLSFIAQLDLPEIAPLDEQGLLPAEGMLWFFYDAARQPWGCDPLDRDAWRVIHAPSASLQRTRPPKNLGRGLVFDACALELRSEMTLPGCYFNVRDREIPLHAFEWYDELRDQLKTESRESIHRLLGHADPVQNDDMEHYCQLGLHGIDYQQAEEYPIISRAASEWILLLQVDTEEATGWMWGDVGRIYYWIRRSDLAARNFDNMWLVLQCC